MAGKFLVISYIAHLVVLDGNGILCQSTLTAQDICDKWNAVGTFPNPLDTTCKQYARCFVNGGVLFGDFYNCSGMTLYNSDLRLCTTGYDCEAPPTVTSSPTTSTAIPTSTDTIPTTSTAIPTSPDTIPTTSTAIPTSPDTTPTTSTAIPTSPGTIPTTSPAIPTSPDTNPTTSPAIPTSPTAI